MVVRLSALRTGRLYPQEMRELEGTGYTFISFTVLVMLHSERLQELAAR